MEIPTYREIEFLKTAWRLRKTPFRPSEVAEVMGLNKNYARIIVKRLTDKGYLERVGYGAYMLSAKAVKLLTRLSGGPHYDK